MAQGRTDLTLQTTDEEIDGMACSTLTKHLRQKFGMTEEETELMKEEEARAELKKRMREARDKAKKGRCAGQPAGNQRELQAEHNRIRERLSQLCHDIAVFLPSLEASTKDILETQFGRAAEDILTDVQTQLQKDECPILVAGETSSGRTTFINKLVGEDIMPVPHSSSTSTICEVKYGETRQAVVHLHHPTGPGHSQITIPLDGTQEQKLKSYIYLEGASQDQLPPAERVEIFWPLPLLKGGIVLVDSPGVGKSEMMDRVVADYIPKVFGLLYIIDSSIRGGVQQDRLEKLLQLWEEKNKDNFYPESAMFICNKWDQVPPEEEDKVKRETFAKLSEMLPGLEESQVFFVSTTDAVGPFGILSEDFTEVLDGLDLLLPNSLDNKLETQYRLLTEISSAALTHIDSVLNVAHQNLNKDTKVERFKEAQKHFQSFEEEVEKSMEELNRSLSRKMKSTKDKLSRIVRTGKLKTDIILNTFGAPNLIMKPLKLWHSDMLAKLQNEKKFTDNNNSVVMKDNFSLLKDFYAALANDLAKCPSFKDHVTTMESHFEQSMKEIVESLEDAHQQKVYDCEMGQMTVSDVLSHTPSGVRRFAAFWKGVSLSSLSRKLRQGKSKGAKEVWGSQSKTEELESILRNCWEEAPAGTPLVDILMQALSSEELLTDLAERQMRPQRDLLTLLEADINKMKDIMEQTIEETFKDTRSNEEIVKTYEPQSRDINSLLGQLSMFHLTEMRKYEYHLDSITGWTDTRNRIGGGSFGEVYRVQVPWNREETQEAALKLMSCTMITTGAADAWNFLKEGDNLRKLRGDHIVEYYGTAYKKERGGLRLGLVMELCEGTLEDRIIGQRDHNPAWWGSDKEKQAAAISYSQNLAVQLCEGLRTIHDAGYIHRDLKLSNVLVTKDDTVKLADVGLTKREVDITGTVAGTPLYTAPEVKERKVYDKSADIYSLGLILWEMWYGQTLDLYRQQDAAYAKQMEEALKEGRDIGMPKGQGTDPPIPEWTSLIHDCLKKEPKERPKIQKCLDGMKDMPCQNKRDPRLRQSAVDSGFASSTLSRAPARSVQRQPTRREKSSRTSHHPREPTSSQTTSLTSSERTTSTCPKSSRGNSETLGTEQTDSAAGRQRDNRKGIIGIERDSGATALAHSREQSGKLLELQKQVTDIVRESHPSLNFIPEENKEADEKRIELNRKTLQEEVFSSDVNFSLEAVIYQLIERRMRSVCCINWPGGSGTGFLLSKGKVLTCNHVYKMMNRASLSFHEANHNTATFFVSVGSKYEVPLEAPAAMCICYSEDLDYAILQLAVSGEMERNLEGLPLLGQFISEDEDSRKLVVLVGHPSGGSKVVDFARIAGVAEHYIIHIRYPNLIQEDKRKPLYDTSVMFHGSSGSPGFDTFGDVVLMHTRGFYPDSSKSVIERGTRLTAIRNHAREILAPEVFNEIFPDPPMSIG